MFICPLLLWENVKTKVEGKVKNPKHINMADINIQSSNKSVTYGYVYPDPKL